MPANENVNIKVSADMAQAIQAWKEIADGPLALERALKRISDLEGQRSKGLARELQNVVGRWVSIGAAITMATQALRSYFDMSVRLRDEATTATRDIDTAARQYFISAGIRPGTAQATRALQRISTTAQTAGAKPSEAFGAARLLSEFGATREQQQGAALTELLSFQDVVNISGRGDPQQLARSVLEIIKRSGQPITGPAVRKLGGAAVQLTGAGAGFDATQLGEFARVARAATDAGLDMPTALSMYAALRETEEPRIARTKYRALLDRKEIPGEREQRAALQRRGAELLTMAGTPYEVAEEIAGGAQVERETQAEARYQTSAYREGIMSRDAIRQNFIAMRRRARGGEGGIGEILSGLTFDLASRFLGPEAAAALHAGDIERSGTGQQRTRQQMLGKEGFNVNIRLKTPDGRDIPHEVEAIGIQER